MILVPPLGIQNTEPLFFGEGQQFNINKTISLPLIDYKSPVIELMFTKLKNKCFKALIDTGAWDNHISTELISELGIYSSSNMKTASHPQLGIIQTPEFAINFSLKGIVYDFTEYFNLMPSAFTYPLILGTHFISKCKEFSINSDVSTFKLIL
jgi:hypothetical protein